MTADDLDALIQEALDGTATPEQRARLERASADPAVARRRAEMEALFTRLRAVEPAEAPTGLRAEVLRRLAVTESADVRAGARRTLAFRGTLRAALPFALGFAAGVIAFVGWNAPRWNAGERGTAATMVAPTPAGDIQSWPVGPATITARAVREGSRLTLSLTSGSPAPRVLELRYDPALTTVVRLGHNGARDRVLEAARGRVRFEPGAGDEVVVEMVDDGAGAPLEVVGWLEAGEPVTRMLPAGFGNRGER